MNNFTMPNSYNFMMVVVEVVVVVVVVVGCSEYGL